MADNKIDWADTGPYTLTGVEPSQITSNGLMPADTIMTSTISFSDTMGTTIGQYSSNTPGTGAAVWTTGTSIYNTAGAGISGPDYGTTIGVDGKMELKGDKADIDINGKSLKNWMEKVEERLNILTPNPDLEKDWDDLRRLGERYRKLEKKCKEKSDVWNKLKLMPKLKVK